MKHIEKILFSRIFLFAVAILTEIFWLFVGIRWLQGVNTAIKGIMWAIGILIVFMIVNKRTNPSYKLAWTILILAIPVFGLVIYFLLGQSKIAKDMEKRFKKINHSANKKIPEDEMARKRLEEKDPMLSNQSKYIRDYGMFPVYKNTRTQYFPSGEAAFGDIIEEIKRAKKYIFLEFFIIARGKMWDTLLKLLEEKAQMGVDVRLVYDDMGCIKTLPHHFYKSLQKKGIKCACFNPFRPIANVILNNRDHRKIIVIDGNIGYTGGINIADEYINEIERFGYWKDTAIKCSGDGVMSFTVMFLQMWEVITKIHENLMDFLPETYGNQCFESDGYVQPYSDTPLDNETVGENVYLNIINQAKDYVYIFTPYLIIDNEMMTALCLASKRGVQVSIVTPGIPDKKYIFLLSQSYYEELILAGVSIYQYSPGFIHAKCMVSDNKVAVVGTINLDYRSLYLHFECGVWLSFCKTILDIKEDALKVMSESEKISLDFCRSRHFLVRILQNIMRVLAPML